MPLYLGTDESGTTAASLQEFAPTFGQKMSAAVREAWMESYGPVATDFVRSRMAEDKRRITAAEAEAIRVERGGGVRMALKPKDNEYTAGQWATIVDRQRELAAVKDVRERTPWELGSVARGAAMFGAGIVDPVNLATAFVPWTRSIGAMRGTVETARTGATFGARTGARAAVGAVDAGISTLALEPLYYAGRQALGDDYDAVDSMANIAFGAAFGGGVHVIGGAAGDAWKAWRARPGMVTPDPMRDVVSAPQGAIVGNETRVRVGNEYEPARWTLVEADTLQATVDKADNQFRDRSRPAYQAEIQQRANNLDPALVLADSPVMDIGAPTLAADGRIVGGNGRTLFITRAYEIGKAGEYRAELERRLANLGIDPDAVRNMQRPVLVRQFSRQVDVKRAAMLSNEGGATVMSPLEQSKVDSERLGDARLQVAQDGALDGAENRPAIRKWVESMPENQRNAVMDSDGRLSPEGQRRLSNAMLFRAYGDSPVLGRLVEAMDLGSRNLASAIGRTAPVVANMRADIASGNLHPLDLAADLQQAVEKFNQLREQGTRVADYMAQMDAFGYGLTPEALMLLEFIGRNIQSPRRLMDGITGFVDRLTAAGNPRQADMFGDAVVPDKMALLQDAIRAAESTPETAAEVAASLTPETREAVLRAAVAQSLDGRAVDVDAIVGMDPGRRTTTIEDVEAAMDRNVSPDEQPLADVEAARAVEERNAAAPKWQALEAADQAQAEADKALGDVVKAGEQAFKYSRDEGPRQTTEALTDAIRTAFGRDSDALMQSGQVEIVSTPKDIPGGPHPADVKAATAPDGRVYVVAENVSPAEARGILLHEVGVHVGMERMLGREVFDAVLTELDDAIARGEDWAQAARAAVPADTPAGLVREEQLAYLVQNAPELPIVQRIIAAVRAWAYRTFEFARERMTLNEADFRAMAVSALREAAQGGRMGEMAPAFSRDAAQTETKAFRNWFGESKVVDAEGKPLVVYHGTFSDFSKFSARRLGENTDGNASSKGYARTAKMGFWFNTQPMSGSSAGYTVDMPVYLSIQNPRREMSLDWLAQGLEGESARSYRARLVEQGYDGVVLRDEEFGGTSYIAFRPEQIKSAIGNRGTFDPTNPDIRYSRGETPDPSTASDELKPHDDAVARAKQFAGVLRAAATKLDNDAQAAASMRAAVAQGGRMGEMAPAFSRDVAQTETKAFRDWFGGSKVVDAEGAPLVVYHGTASDFAVFDPLRAGSNFGQDSAGIFFAERPNVAAFSAAATAGFKSGGGDNIMPVYLAIKNPIVYEAKVVQRPFNDPRFMGGAELFDAMNKDAVIKAASDGGHDGVHVKAGADGDGLWIAFRPEQIKSATGNRGTFDPTNPDIRYSRGETPDPSTAAEELKTYDDAVSRAKQFAGVLRAAATKLDNDAQAAASMRAAMPDITPAEIDDLLAQLRRQVTGLRGMARSARDAVTADDRAAGMQDDAMRAADMLSNNLQIAAVIERRNAALNIAARLRASTFLQQFNRPELDFEGFRALLVGTQRKRAAGRLSVDAEAKAFRGEWLGGMISDMERAGIWREFTSGEFDRDVFIALHAMGRGEQPQVSPVALKIAEVVNKYQEDARNTRNRFGAWIRDLSGYITRQTHDMFKIRDAGFKEWSEYVLPRLDLAKTLRDFDGTIDQFLTRVYDDFASGQHMKTPAGEDDLAAFGRGSNLARRESASRVLYFKDGSAAHEYNVQFGQGRLADTVLQGLESSARSAAMLKTLGTNPEAAVDRLFREYADNLRGDPARRAAFMSKRGELDNLLAEVSGAVNIPGSATVAKWTAFSRAWITMAKLGGMLISSITDVSNYAAELRFGQDRNLLSGVLDGIGGLTRGRAKGERAEVLRSLGVFHESMIGAAVHRFDSPDLLGGKTAATLQQFFKFTGINWWTETLRDSYALSHSSYLASNAGKAWDKLPEALRDMLGLYNIDAGKWDVLRVAPLKTADGQVFMSAEGLATVPRAVLENYIQQVGRTVSDASVQNLRDDLAGSLRAMTIDRMHHAVLEPGARTRAFMRRGTQPGTVPGELLRYIGQFKSFPVAMVQMVLGREVYGRGYDTLGEYIRKGKGEMLGLASFIALSVGMGYAAMSVKDLLRGRNPRPVDDPRTWMAAFVQGGGLGIYGDFLFGRYNRMGSTLSGSLVGPAAGVLDTAADLWTRIRMGDDVAAASFKALLDNTPFMNIFYTRAVLDYLILHQIQEALNPGFLRRMERRIENDHGQTFWLPPSQAAL